jgi:hypothetical protein
VAKRLPYGSGEFLSGGTESTSATLKRSRSRGEARTPYTPEEIRQAYERFARWYDLADGVVKLLGAARGRRELLRRVLFQRVD